MPEFRRSHKRSRISTKCFGKQGISTRVVRDDRIDVRPGAKSRFARIRAQFYHVRCPIGFTMDEGSGAKDNENALVRVVGGGVGQMPVYGHFEVSVSMGCHRIQRVHGSRCATSGAARVIVNLPDGVISVMFHLEYSVRGQEGWCESQLASTGRGRSGQALPRAAAGRPLLRLGGRSPGT
jgi:hypothetical protein